MEVWNTGCAEEGNEDMNAPYWDEILGEGQPVFGVATDDGHPMRQHCRGWVMVRARSRSVKDILAALKEGAFYASTGPVIHDFYVEDGIAHIQCDPAAWIEFSSDMHPTRHIRGEEGKTVTEASYDLSRYGGYRYVLCGCMRGLGYAVLPMIVSLVGACGFRILWIFTVFPLDPTIRMLYVSYPISWALTAVAHLVCFILCMRKVKSIWKRRITV